MVACPTLTVRIIFHKHFLSAYRNEVRKRYKRRMKRSSTKSSFARFCWYSSSSIERESVLGVERKIGFRKTDGQRSVAAICRCCRRHRHCRRHFQRQRRVCVRAFGPNVRNSIKSLHPSPLLSNVSPFKLPFPSTTTISPFTLYQRSFTRSSTSPLFHPPPLSGEIYTTRCWWG